LPLNIGQHHPQGFDIAVDVADNGPFHVQSLPEITGGERMALYP
jgi:hypothetical protein